MDKPEVDQTKELWGMSQFKIINEHLSCRSRALLNSKLRLFYSENKTDFVNIMAIELERQRLRENSPCNFSHGEINANGKMGFTRTGCHFTLTTKLEP